MTLVKYQFEYDELIPCAFIGAGGHSYRNVYPAFQYAPVDLLAVCDVDERRAAAYARQFGAGRHYTDHREMLAAELPRAVFIVTSYDADGRVQATDLAVDCLRAGSHVWMEKPTAASTDEIRVLQRESDAAERFVFTGLKKIFTPVSEKLKSIISSPEFGPVSSISVRYPQAIPAFEDRADLNAMRGFLDHIYHPAAILGFLMGPIERFSHEWSPDGGSVASLKFASGAVGTLHLCAGTSETSPLERVEVVGRDANVVADNGVRLTYYRPNPSPRGYGRSGSFLVADSAAPLLWEPEFSLGQLYNKNLFYLGYVPEVLHFCESVLTGNPPSKGTLADSLAIMELFEAYQRTPPGVVATLPVPP